MAEKTETDHVKQDTSWQRQTLSRSRYADRDRPCQRVGMLTDTDPAKEETDSHTQSLSRRKQA